MMGRATRTIRRTLFVGVLLTTTSALFVSGLIMVLYDLGDYNTRLFQDLTTQSRLLALANASALQFNDPNVAQESLATLEARPQIIAAAMYNAKNSLFASYRGKDNPEEKFPRLPEADNQRVDGEYIIVFQRIIDHGETLGTIYLKANYQLYDRVWKYVSIVLSVAVVALFVAMLFSLWLQMRVARPILHITDVARKVSEQQDYSLRAKKSTNDEIGYLVDAFNQLLAQVGERRAQLEATNQQLQHHIHERDLANHALTESERRYRMLVTMLTSIVWLTDAEGNLLEKQTRWGEYTGQTPEQQQHWGWLNAFHQDDRDLLNAAWTQARATVQPLKCEAQLWSAASNSYRYVGLGMVPLLDDNGVLREWIGTADDIDERRRALLEVQRLNAELEQRVSERTAELERANKELEAFSYSVSHDLRTPLRAIDGFSQALLEDYGTQLDATGTDYLARVRSGAQRMGSLIDALLTLARVSRTSMHEEKVDLTAIAEDIVGELRAVDPERIADIRIAPYLSAMGDPYLLRIVLENLFNNAWKYSGKRELTVIEFGMRKQDGEPCFFVQDNGAGFDMAYANKLFGAFQRLHDAKEFVGTGVGLATVQRIIHRHGGRIWATAAVDQGAAFYFTLPLPFIEEIYI